MRTSSLRLASAILAPSLALLLAAPGCGDDEPSGNGGSGASGSNSGASSGTGAASVGGSSSGGSSSGGSASGGGGSGSGGADPGEYDCSAAAGEVGALALTEIATGLDVPLQVKAAPGDNDRLFIVEQSGAIRLVKGGAMVAEPFLEIADVGYQSPGYETGLLGLAFHPDYATNGRFFVHYNVDNNTHIAEYHATPGSDVADAGEVATVIDVDQPATDNHKGGSIEFGKDGMLYIFLGDGGGGGDQGNRAQNLDVLLGKVLRIDVSSLPYTVPAGNLPGGQPEIWDYGVRNPYRSTFDACTGDLYIADVGQDEWEEVNVEPAGQGNKNYGWRCKEGEVDYNTSQNCEGKTFTEPVTVYPHSAGKVSVTGGYVYRGSAIPGLRGTYLYGDVGSGDVFSFVWDGTSASQPGDLGADLDTQGMNITSFGQDNKGEMYVVDYSGTVYRIDPE
jgi:glucose/arabinose dehydrogenase